MRSTTILVRFLRSAITPSLQAAVMRPHVKARGRKFRTVVPEPSAADLLRGSPHARRQLWKMAG